MEQRKLLILSYDFPPSSGGIARLCHEISMRLNTYYQHIRIITINNTSNLKPYNNLNIDVTKLPSKRIFSELAAISIIRKIKEKNTYDVICGVWHPEAILAYLGGMKNIYILGHGTEFLYGTSKFRKSIWLPIYAKWILKKSKKIICNSHYTQKLVKRISTKIKTEAIPLAVNHTFFSPDISKDNTGIIKFCTVSRILKFKGHDFILKTFENLPEEIKLRIEWHIAGTGPYYNELEKRINKSPFKNKIKLHGFVDDDKLADFYNQSNVFILATREQSTSTQVEGFGLVFLEAQSCGLPAIGTNTGGIPDAIDNGNGGWLIEQDNEKELKELVINLVNNPSKIIDQSIKARQRILLECTWENYCEKLYNKIAE